MKRRDKGITLIALVITIIVLLILAGVVIATLTGDNGILTKAVQAKEKTEEARLREEEQLEDLEDYMNEGEVTEKGYVETYKVNKPKIKIGMIPVYYDETGKVWKKADENNTDKQWYDYENKKWANIVTVADTDKELRNAAVGTEIPIEKITTFFVWVPRYAYSITSGYKQGGNVTGTIDVTFLKGNTNVGTDGVTYETDYNETQLSAGARTPKIVHPGFKMGRRELTGIWIAKFESSGTNKDGNAVGNGTSTSNSQQYAPDSTTYVKSLPSVTSWRYITIGESEYRCMQMSSNTSVYGWGNVNTHLIKNSEWASVAYLSYSQFGSVPKINGCGNVVSGSHYYDLYTGMGPGTNEGRYNSDETTRSQHEYNTANGVLASTTGNVYGVYDMSGGAWERVAAYLDNGNSNLNSYGKSTSDSSIKYFENGKLNSSYSSLWDRYEVGEEEKSNSIAVEGEATNLTQSQLWNKSGTTYTDTTINKKYNTARKRITDATYNLLEKVKGIGVNEVAASHSYYGVCSTGGYAWLLTEDDTSTRYGKAWDNDLVLIGHAFFPFVVRGGNIDSGTGAGVFNSAITDGTPHNNSGFRAALCV